MSEEIIENKILRKILKEEIERSKRYKRPLSAIMADLNHGKLKSHLIANSKRLGLIVKAVGKEIKKTLRTTDKFFFSDENVYICILPETDLKSAGIVARRIRKLVHDIPFSRFYPDDDISLSISIGTVQLGIGAVYNDESLIKTLKYTLEEAKENGSNSLRFHGSRENEVSKNENRKNRRTMQKIILKGKSISSGFALGNAFIYSDILTRNFISYRINEHEIEQEFQRILSAIEVVIDDLHKMEEVVKYGISKNDAEIFNAYKIMLTDQILLEDLKIELKKELVNAEKVVQSVFCRWANKFKATDTDIFRSRAEDLEDLSRKILKVLLGYEKNVLEKLPDNSIVVAKRLLPSDTVHLERKKVKGIVVVQGSHNSHSAILARSMGIPALSNVIDACDIIEKDDVLLLDGDKEQVLIHPSSDDLENYQKKITKSNLLRQASLKKNESIAFTKDKERIYIYANGAGVDDFETAKASGCDGIGLFRIEQIYLSSKILPDDETLFLTIKRILEPVIDFPVTIRLLDIGGDKNLPYLEMEEEISPYLGLRGIRVLLKYENILKSQIYAILRLSKKYRIKILIPMVCLPWEVVEVKKILNECRKEMEKKFHTFFPVVPVGSMIETPAALYHLDGIARHSDFLSIGSNDLIQYIMAAGRENITVSRYYEEGEGLIIQIIGQVVAAVKKYEKECSVCGEIASDLDRLEGLIKAGIRSVSVIPHMIPAVKDKVSTISVK